MSCSDGILIIHMGALGDIILSLPAMQLIRNYHIRSRLSLLGHETILRLIKDDLDAYRIDSIDQALFITLFSPAMKISLELDKYFKNIRIIYIFTRNTDSIFISNLKNIYQKNIRIISCKPPCESSIHVTHYQLHALSDLHTGIDFLPVCLNIKNKSRKIDIHEYLPKQGLNQYAPKHIIIGIHPGSGSPKKCCPKKFFGDLIKKLALNEQLTFLLFLGPAEAKWEESLLENMVPLKVNIKKNKSLSETTDLLKYCQVFIGNDSGMSHLASALGIPTIAIFGPTCPDRWQPLGAHVRVLSPNMSCAPCERDRYIHCDHPKCLESITIEEAMRAVCQFLI